jgi:hypothetical protein
LISRNGHSFYSFADLSQAISASASNEKKIVIDGEIMCLDDSGKPQFRDLLFHRAEPCFYAFDLLMRDGKDLRSERLADQNGFSYGFAVSASICTVIRRTVRREKALVHSGMKDPSGNWIAPPGSNRSGGEGNEAAEV